MRTQSLAFVLVAALAGCSGSSTRTVTGQLMTRTSSAVVAQSMNHEAFSSDVSSTGHFTLQLPTGASYELAVGQTRINWPTAEGAARWAKLGAGPTLDLGHVAKSGDHFECDHHGSDDDHCDRDDDHDGGDDEGGGDDGDEHEGSHSCDGGSHSGGGGSGSGGGGTGGAGGGGGVSTGGGGIP
jgi:hypothetical protein